MTTRWRRSTAPATAVTNDTVAASTKVGEWTRPTNGNATGKSTAIAATPTPTPSSSVPSGSSSTPRRATTGTGGVTAVRKTSDASSSLRVALLERNAAGTGTGNDRLTKSTPPAHRYLNSSHSPSSSVIGSPNGGPLGEAKHSLFATNSPIEERLRTLKLTSNAGQSYEAAHHRESSILDTKPKGSGGNGGGGVDDSDNDSDSDMDIQPRRRLDYAQVSAAGSAYEDVDADDSDDSVMSNDSMVSVSARTGYHQRKSSARANSGRRRANNIMMNSSRHGHHGHDHHHHNHHDGTRRNSNPRVMGAFGRPPIDDDDDDDWANDAPDSLVVGRPVLVDAVIAPAPSPVPSSSSTSTHAATVVIVPPSHSSAPSSSSSSSSSTTLLHTSQPPASSSSSLQCPSQSSSSSPSRPRSRSPSAHRHHSNGSGNNALSPSPIPGSPGKIPSRLTSRRPPAPSPAIPITAPLPSSSTMGANNGSNPLSSLSPPDGTSHVHHFSPGVARLSASSLERTQSEESDDNGISPIPPDALPMTIDHHGHGHGNTNHSSWRHPDPHHQHNHSHLDRHHHLHHSSNGSNGSNGGIGASTSTLTSNPTAEAILAQAAGLAMLRHISTTGMEYERHATPSASPVAMLPLYMPPSPSTLVPVMDPSRSNHTYGLTHHTSGSLPSPRSTTIHSPSSARHKVVGMSLNDADLHHLGMSLDEKSPATAMTPPLPAMTTLITAASSIAVSSSNSNRSSDTSMSTPSSIPTVTVSSLPFSDAAFSSGNDSSSPSPMVATDGSAPLSSRGSASARRIALDPAAIDNYHARANAYKMVTI